MKDTTMTKKVLSDRELDRQLRVARRRTLWLKKQPWYPVAAAYEASADRLVLELKCGVLLAIPRKQIPWLQGKKKALLAKVWLSHTTLGWDDLDVHLSALGLIERFFAPLPVPPMDRPKAKGKQARKRKYVAIGG